MEVTNIVDSAMTELNTISDIESANSSADLHSEKYEIIIEEITRNHKLLHRHQLCQESIKIGRDYQNDVILTDPYICPKHLSLIYEKDGFYLQDNNSINGTGVESAQGKKHKHCQQKINDGDVITLGKSQLRIRFKNHAVAKTIAFGPFEPLINIIKNPVAVITSIILFMLITANITYLNQLTETNISQLFVGAFSKTLLFVIWPASVALISQLTKNDPRILAQVGVSFTFFILMWLSDLLGDIVAFNTSSDSVLGVVITLITIFLAFSLFWLNSYIGFHVSAKRRMITALSITTLLFGGSYLIQYSQKPEFDPQPRYSSAIMAPSYLLAPSNTVDTFIEDSNKLFELADKAIKKN